MLEGSMVALITPFSGGEIDETHLRRLVRYQEENGTDVLVPCGTTGESATLTHDEHERVIKIVVDEARTAKVMAGTGSNSTHEAIRLTRFAQEVGCDAGLVITPYYNKPTQHGMIQHFKKVADSVDMDLVLYNVPGRTGINLEAGTVIELSKVKNIVGVKEASGDIGQITEISRSVPDDFSVLSGDDGMTLPILSVGGNGVVSVIANIAPGLVKEIVHSWRKGNYAQARKTHMKLFPLMNGMFLETNPIPVKFAASRLKLCKNELRLPMTPLSENFENSLVSMMREAGLNPQ